MSRTKKVLATLLPAACLVAARLFAQSNIMAPGSSFHGIRDFREVMPQALYRGGANNGRGPLRQAQLTALCEDGMGTAIYLYTTGFVGNSTVQCSKGSLDYIDKGWEGAGRSAVHQKIYNTIKNHGKPVFVHCWYGIHATGAVAATALMQFCHWSPEKAVQYWKVGIAPKVQYPKIIRSIMNFKPDPHLELTAEQAEYCPKS